MHLFSVHSVSAQLKRVRSDMAQSPKFLATYSWIPPSTGLPCRIQVTFTLNTSEGEYIDPWDYFYSQVLPMVIQQSPDDVEIECECEVTTERGTAPSSCSPTEEDRWMEFSSPSENSTP